MNYVGWCAPSSSKIILFLNCFSVDFWAEPRQRVQQKQKQLFANEPFAMRHSRVLCDITDVWRASAFNPHVTCDVLSAGVYASMSVSFIVDLAGFKGMSF